MFPILSDGLELGPILHMSFLSSPVGGVGDPDHSTVNERRGLAGQLVETSSWPRVQRLGAGLVRRMSISGLLYTGQGFIEPYAS